MKNMKEMICGMRNRKDWSWLLPFSLVIAVLISIVFTALIWITPSHFQFFASRTAPKTGDRVDKNVADKQTLSDVYLPVSLTYCENDTRYQLSSTKVDVIDLARRSVRNVKIRKITGETFRNREQYLRFLNLNDSYSLNYSAPVTLSMFRNHMEKKMKGWGSCTFSRILVPLGRKGVIYFMDDHNLKVYTAQINASSVRKMSSIIARRDVKMVRIEYRIFNNRIMKYYLQQVDVPKSSYLINRENTGLFVTRLLGSSSSSTVNAREQKKQTVYTDDAGQRMVVRNNGYASYTNYEKDTSGSGKHSLHDSLDLSFERLKLLDVALDDVRYSEFDFQNKTVVYRSYINGFPIISADEYGSYHVQVSDSGSEHIVFSLYTLQVPVPADSATVTLPDMEGVMEGLKQGGVDLGRVNGIQIGYATSRNESSPLVIDLTPTYFVKYNNVWIDYRDLVHGEVAQ